MKVKILRRVSPDTESYWETFDAETTQDMTVAGLLDYLNYHDDIMDETGKRPPVLAGNVPACRAPAAPAPW